MESVIKDHVRIHHLTRRLVLCPSALSFVLSQCFSSLSWRCWLPAGRPLSLLYKIPKPLLPPLQVRSYDPNRTYCLRHRFSKVGSTEMKWDLQNFVNATIVDTCKAKQGWQVKADIPNRGTRRWKRRPASPDVPSFLRWKIRRGGNSTCSCDERR